ncbi:MAG TPA: ribosome biogenesis GTP-binding protein YihA/YsxC [Chitinophagaceae bacterium]|nr:ribosome biogenesis GTP-binding protein YihA/YsxC [Chitinophagaceae bacterium]
MQIKEAKYIISSPSVDKCPKPDKPEFAFIGRSNVGKSSLINMLTGKRELAKVSANPGKTQLINHFEITSYPSPRHRERSEGRGEGKGATWFLVDLPGYGFAIVSQKQRKGWEKMIDDYIRKRETLANLFVLVDSRHEPQKKDIDFINRLGEWQIPFAIVFTKTDKNKPGATVRNINAFMTELSKTWTEPPVYFSSSTVKGTGKEEILDFIGSLLTKV